MPPLQVGATVGLILFGIALTVFAGPLYEYAHAAAESRATGRSSPRPPGGTAMRQKKSAVVARFRFRPLSILGMTAVWIILWGSISPMVILSGVLLGWVIGIVFPLPPMHWEGRFRPLGFLNLVASGSTIWWALLFRMIRLAFAKKVDLNAGIVRVDLDSDNDLYQVQVAELISPVPGTVVVEVVRHPCGASTCTRDRPDRPRPGRTGAADGPRRRAARRQGVRLQAGTGRLSRAPGELETEPATLEELPGDGGGGASRCSPPRSSSASPRWCCSGRP